MQPTVRPPLGGRPPTQRDAKGGNSGYVRSTPREYINDAYGVDPTALDLPPLPNPQQIASAPPLLNPNRSTLRNFPPFRATWLTNVNGRTEAKSKPVTTLDLRSLSSLPARLLNDARVLEAAQLHLGSRRPGVSVYAFERCAATQRDHMDRGVRRGEGELATTAEDRAYDATNYRALSEDEATCRRYNHALSVRLRMLVDADALMSKLQEVRGGGVLGNREDANKAMELAKFRREAYMKTAKIVEDYPLPVTFEDVAWPALPDATSQQSTASALPTQQSTEDGEPAAKRIRPGDAETPTSLPSLLGSGMEATPLRATAESTGSPPTPRRGGVSYRPAKIAADGSLARRLKDAIADLFPLHFPRVPGSCGRNRQGPFQAAHRLSPEYQSDAHLLLSAEVRAMLELRKIWGVGPKAAATLASWGIGGVAHLREDKPAHACLNRCQRIGLDNYADINSKIPRAEIAAILAHVQEVTTRLSKGKVECVACGSYRRGAASSGDIDIMLIPKDRAAWEDDRAGLDVYDLVRRELERTDFITDMLTFPNMFGEMEGEAPATEAKGWMGLCRLPKTDPQWSNKKRRLDLKAYRGCQAAFALLYFTGSAVFNRSMRGMCKKAGLTLSDSGLSLTRRDAVTGKKVETRESVQCTSEEDVFDALGVEFVGPEYRDVGCGVGWEATGGVDERGKFWTRTWDDGIREMNEA